MYPVLRHFNNTLMAWAMRKYRRLKGPQDAGVSLHRGYFEESNRNCLFTGNEGWLARLLDGSGVNREAPAPF